MRIGLQIGLTDTHQKPLGDYIIRVAEQADQAGFAAELLPIIEKIPVAGR